MINIDKAININLENLKLNRKDEYDSLFQKTMNGFKDREHSINISILELKEKNLELIENSKDYIMLTPENFNNAITLEKYLKLNNDFTTLTNSISKIKKQLEPEKLADTTYNHLSNGEYAKLVGEIYKIKAPIADMSTKIDLLMVKRESEVNRLKEEMAKLRKEAKPFEIELEKLKKSYEAKFEIVKNKIEVKFKNKLILSEKQKPIMEDSLAIIKSNFIKDSSLNTLLREKKDSLNREKGDYEHNSKYYTWLKESINEKFTNGKIEGRAKNMMTKGAYYLAKKDYKQYKRELDNIEAKLKNTSFTNIVEKVKLNKEKGVINDKVKTFGDQLDKMNEMFRNQPKELKVYMDKITNVKIEILKTYNTKYNTTKKIEFEIKTEIDAISNLEKTLVNNVTLQNKHNISITNPFEAYKENTNIRGGSASILDQEDEILKGKKKNNGLSL